MILIRVHSLIVLFALLCTAFVSCNADIDPPEIRRVRPSHHEVVSRDVCIEVCFSEPMHRNRTESAFSVSNRDGTVNGSYQWDDNGRNMTFIPELPLQNGFYYNIRIDKGAEDRHGNSITIEYISGFFAGEDMIPPVVTEIYPKELTANFPLDGKIRITFSEPMNRMSVERGMRFSPYIDGLFSWSVDFTCVEFLPFSNLDFNTSYRISVTDDCMDVSGNILLNSIESFFTAGDEFKRPELTGVIDSSTGNDWTINGNFFEYHGVEKNASITFLFSESVGRDSFHNALRIIPDIDKAFSWNEGSTRCTVHFIDGLSPLQRYELRIKRGLKDIAGNEMGEDFAVFFTVDGTGSLPPDITGLVLIKDGNDGDITEIPLSEGQITFPGLEFSDENCYEIRITFNADIDRTSVPGNIEIDFIYGEQSSFEGSVKRYMWTDPHKPEQVLLLTVSSIEGGNLYRLLLRGGERGIKGRNGTALREDLCCYFQFEADD